MQANGLGRTNLPGLPNILGTFGGSDDDALGGTAVLSGAMYNTGKTWGSDGGGSSQIAAPINGFSANRSSEIYGSSNTVMPGSINLACIIYLGK